MRTIMRYKNNRKMYCTETHNYVNLVDIRDMLLTGIDFQILDKPTRTDITAQVLASLVAHEAYRGVVIPNEIKAFLKGVVYANQTQSC